MRVLLDTNIIIHRENNIVSNYSIGHLFRWLDKLKAVKVIHPYTIDEINKHGNPTTKAAFQVKLESYEVVKTIKAPNAVFSDKLRGFSLTPNDHVDNQLLYEAYSGRVDILITEDRKMLRKAEVLGISERVWSINRFISHATATHPEQIDYKMLAVKKEYFGNIDLDSPFFNSFKRDYAEFTHWFSRKCDDIAYICEDENKSLLGFLYIKVEDTSEDCSNILPVFQKARRLKIGTFKVESTGFRLGERFIKIIFDNAILNNVDEIYVTLFQEREELTALYDLLTRWGFIYHGIKTTSNGEEAVLVKKLKQYDNTKSVKENFPNVAYNKQKFILPILPQYHTTLLPDSRLNNEKVENFLEMLPHRYALQKAYISFSFERNINSGDLFLFYRNGPNGTQKGYTSVITTVGVVDEIAYNFKTKEEYLRYCQNRTVFSDSELEHFWATQKDKIMVIKFIFIESLTNKIILKRLWDMNVIPFPSGPRPFTQISDEQFNAILQESDTDLTFF